MKLLPSGLIDCDNMALTTDLYQLTMAQVYLANGKNDLATFDLFVRKLPENRGYMIAAGLEQALFYLTNVKFGRRALDCLSRLGRFSDDFLDYLTKFRFNGDVYAIPEGTPVFANEPILRVTAPRIEAQLVETYLLNLMNYETLIATKASRIVDAAEGRAVIEFGLRRAPSPQAGLLASRASYIAGCAGSSNVAAYMEFGIPPRGTMAHAMVLSFKSEEDAFEAYSREFPEGITYLIDTYDSVEGTKSALCASRRLGVHPSAIRLDSGDFDALSRRLRKLLDEQGMNAVKIFVSGDMNEYKIAALTSDRAPVDAYGVGTDLVTSRDAPSLGGVYKLAEDSSGAKMKLSENKVTLPGKKQVIRIEKNGRYVKDVIILEGEEFKVGKPLLVKVLSKGKPARSMPTLEEIRAHCMSERAKIPANIRRITNPERYDVELSPSLKRLMQELTQKLTKNHSAFCSKREKGHHSARGGAGRSGKTQVYKEASK